MNREEGLKGEYFDNADFTDLKHVTIERSRFPISKDWQAGAPAPTMEADSFSVRWTGKVKPPSTDTYTFSFGNMNNPTDTAKLWIDGVLVADTVAGFSNPVALTSGQYYDLRVDYTHHTGNAAISLRWQRPSTSPSVIGQTWLFHELPLPHIAQIKEGPGDEHHIVSPNTIRTESKPWGALIDGTNGTEFVFHSDTVTSVTYGAASFTGAVGYAEPGGLALFEGNAIRYDDFELSRSGGDFGVSAVLVDNSMIEGRFAGKSGGTITVKPPSAFGKEGVNVTVDGQDVPFVMIDGVISFEVSVSQSDGYKQYVISSVPVDAPQFYDDFEDGDAAGWHSVHGIWSVELDDNNYVYKQSDAAGGAATSGDILWTDYIVEANVKLADAQVRADLFGRYTNGDNFYYLQLNGAEHRLKLYRKASGVVTLLASAPVNVQTGHWYKLSMQMNGSDIECRLNGNLRISVSDASLSAGKIGLRGSGESMFDDVIVLSIP